MTNIIVTGGCGFIGREFCRLILQNTDNKVINLDSLTYAGNLANTKAFESYCDYTFIKGDICDGELVSKILHDYHIDVVINFAAESHVDNSINNPNLFFQTNVMGTITLLEAIKQYGAGRNRSDIVYVQVSTDEVYGDLKLQEPAFTELSPIKPSSPYSASKAAADMAVVAYNRTYGLPYLITRCSNNYGPYQNAEKLIPKVISQAMKGAELPIYGTGQNIRDWLHVSDHCAAIWQIIESGNLNTIYNIGSQNEKTNLELVIEICKILDDIRPLDGKRYQDLISFVGDRSGHDFRYAINPQKLRGDVDWFPVMKFEDGLKETVNWFLSPKEST